MPLPKIPGRAVQKMRWPEVPTSRLGIAVLLKSGREIGDVDLICGTAFLHALGGDNMYTKEDYYLQLHGTTMVALHVP
eukprot:3534106-Amphidinium_carterae.1